MKTLVYFSIVVFTLLLNVQYLLSQGSEIESKQANKYLQQFDSLSRQNSNNSDSALELNNNNVDSMIQVKVNCTENRIYLADSNALRNHGEIDGLIEKMEMQMNTIQTQTQDRINYKQQEMDSCVNQVKNSFMYQVKELDSLANQYEYMQSHQEQYNDSAINAVNAQIQNQCLKLDSVLQNQEGSCNKYRDNLDSIIQDGQTKLDSMFMKKQGEIDSLLGIQSQTRFRISHKNADSNDSSNNKNRYKFSEIVDEIVLLDTTDIRLKFNKKIAEPQEIKNLFKFKLVELLKSTSTESIEIVEIFWSNQKADVLQFIINVPLYNPELIELEYNGEVELNANDELVLKSTAVINDISDEINISNFNVYPNPATDYIQINISDDINLISIYSLNGTKIIEYLDNFSFIDISTLQSGLYILHVTNISGKLFTTKLIKR